MLAKSSPPWIPAKLHLLVEASSLDYRFVVIERNPFAGSCRPQGSTWSSSLPLQVINHLAVAATGGAVADVFSVRPTPAAPAPSSALSSSPHQKSLPQEHHPFPIPSL